jgi:hypothetical protein
MPEKQKKEKTVTITDMHWRIRCGTGYSIGFNQYALCKPEEVIYTKPSDQDRFQSIEIGTSIVSKGSKPHLMAMASSAKGGQIMWYGFGKTGKAFYGLNALTCRVPQDKALAASMLVNDD